MNHAAKQCPIKFGLSVFGDRWSLLIIRDMIFRGYTRFQEFAGAAEGIATSVLSDRLSRLKAQMIISRRRDPDDGRQILYSLTDKRADLLPVLLTTFAWAERHDLETRVPETRVPGDLADWIRADFGSDHDGLLNAVRQAIAEP